MSGARTILGPVSSALGPDPNTGTITATFPAQQTDWMLYRLTISGPANSIAHVHKDVAQLGTRIGVSYFGEDDDADFPAGAYIPSGSQLIVVWYTIVSAGSVTASIAAPAPITAILAPASAVAELSTITLAPGSGAVPSIQ